MFEILRSTLTGMEGENADGSALSSYAAKSRAFLRRVPDEWALLFGIGFAVGIAAGSFFA